MLDRMQLGRRQALALGLGAGAAMLLPGKGLAAAQKMEILVAYYGALINTAVVGVGLEKGYYSTPLVEVTDAVSTTGGGTAIRNMVGGNVDYGIVGTSAALTGMREGIDVRIVHGAIRTMEDLFWVSMPNSGIKSIQDLKGKKIGFTKPKSISETMIRWMLKKHGMDGQVQLISTGAVGSGLSALESGGVDATLILEPLWSARKGRYQVAFTLSELPPMSQMVGVATGKMIREQPEVLKALIGAWGKSVDFTYSNGDEAAALMSKRYGAQNLPVDVAKEAVANLQKIKYWSRGEIDIVGLDFWVQAMKEQGEWEGDPDWSKMINQTFLAENLRR
ncbi:MAG TPA: ABC transporter substrate-binding protein [Aliidongia sp.]|uniref:ABC transporter substrate-binding protein n=1 Tax=Aliidongia sp. TaxID=1914230 RepID=UPI002DDCEE12|nr:ABC transporter substrate-binding protein [Aliidongia sp.]HEV2673773.1 ABC transporter substrate-binding protein [Aliidongia sp.]